MAGPPADPVRDRVRRVDTAAIVSIVLAIAWPLITLIMVNVVPMGGGGFRLVMNAFICWCTVIGFGAWALARIGRAPLVLRGRWLAAAGIGLAALQMAVAVAVVYACTRPDSTCFTFTF